MFCTSPSHLNSAPGNRSENSHFSKTNDELNRIEAPALFRSTSDVYFKKLELARIFIGRMAVPDTSAD